MADLEGIGLERNEKRPQPLTVVISHGLEVYDEVWMVAGGGRRIATD